MRTMTAAIRSVLFALSLGAGVGFFTMTACGGNGAAGGGAGGTLDPGKDGGAGGPIDAAPPDLSKALPIAPALGAETSVAVSCEGAYPLPLEFEGPEGLGGVGWTLADLENTVAWNVPNRFQNNWISDNADTHPSVRVHPERAPEAAACYRALVEASAMSAPETGPLAPTLQAVSAFSFRGDYYDALASRVYAPPAYDLSHEDALVGAIRGLYEKPNIFTGAPVVPPWNDDIAKQVASATASYPPSLRRALARLVLSIGEAHDLKAQALAGGDMAIYEKIFQRFMTEKYYPQTNLTRIFEAPATAITDIRDHGDEIDLSRFHLAAQSVAAAADEVNRALTTIAPFDAPPLDVLTPHGRILVRTTPTDDTYAAEELADAVVIVDAGGDDQYGGRYAATHQFWMSASVLVDARGNDRYNPEQADISLPATTGAEALAAANAFTQGAGLFGVGVLVDGAGDDTYRASAYAQGAAGFGVGVLADYGGHDSYQTTIIGQGAGYFGVGMLLDAAGDDRYGVYMVGQGNGRPGGHGLLLDLGGDDQYTGYYNDDPPELPSPGYTNFHGAKTGYDDAMGEAHHLSMVQGVGMGFRGDWLNPVANWMGGFGALLDLGAGKDTYFSDCLSMGQGFVYGFGLLYDGGGDDKYRAFWWALGSGTHMGTGVLMEEGGADDYLVTHASAALGHDTGVSWFLDHGGNDTYAGQMRPGRSLSNGLAFFIDKGGDDIYTLPPGADSDPNVQAFGHVYDALGWLKRVGLFMDLGGGNDTYVTARPEVKNDAVWHLAPLGSEADPANHKGIGVDE